MPGVIVSYKGTAISNLIAPVSKTLQTSGKYCEDDITIDYTNPDVEITPQKDRTTRLYLTIPSQCNLTQLPITLYWDQSVSRGVTIDWGDTSTTQTVYGTGSVNSTQHRYSSGGLYVVKMTVNSGCEVKLGNGASSTGLLGVTGETASPHYRSVLKAIEIGRGVSTIQAYCFCRSALETIIFGPDVTTFGGYSMIYSYALGSMHFLGTLPQNSGISTNSPFGYIPAWCKIYVPPAYISSQGNPQNIPSRLPSTSTYTYAVEPYAS